MGDHIRHLSGGEPGIDRHDAGPQAVQRQKVQKKLGPVVQHQGDPPARAVAGNGVSLPQGLRRLQGLPVGVINGTVVIARRGLMRDVQKRLRRNLFFGLQEFIEHRVHAALMESCA